MVEYNLRHGSTVVNHLVEERKVAPGSRHRRDSSNAPPPGTSRTPKSRSGTRQNWLPERRLALAGRHTERTSGSRAIPDGCREAGGARIPKHLRVLRAGLRADYVP